MLATATEAVVIVCSTRMGSAHHISSGVNRQTAVARDLMRSDAEFLIEIPHPDRIDLRNAIIPGAVCIRTHQARSVTATGFDLMNRAQDARGHLIFLFGPHDTCLEGRWGHHGERHRYCPASISFKQVNIALSLRGSNNCAYSPPLRMRSKRSRASIRVSNACGHFISIAIRMGIAAPRGLQ